MFTYVFWHQQVLFCNNHVYSHPKTHLFARMELFFRWQIGTVVAGYGHIVAWRPTESQSDVLMNADLGAIQ